MKKVSIIFVLATLFLLSGCIGDKKNLYLPEASNDKVYTAISGGDGIYHGSIPKIQAKI